LAVRSDLSQNRRRESISSDSFAETWPGTRRGHACLSGRIESIVRFARIDIDAQHSQHGANVTVRANETTGRPVFMSVV
jgi:hypothetical protein